MIESKLCALSMAKGFSLRLWRALPAAFRNCRSRGEDGVVAAAAVSSSARCLPTASSDCFDVAELLPPSPFRRRLHPSPRHVCPASAGGEIDYEDGNAMRGRGDGRRRRRLRRRRRRERIRKGWGNNSSADEDSGWFSSDELNGEFGNYYSDGGGTEEEEERDADSSCSYFWQGRTKKTITGRDGGWRMRSWVAEDVAVAVVKRSEDPTQDFRRSMAEMVVEKKIFDAAGLEELLICFLSFNSRDHHAAIIAAFRDVWSAVSPAATAGDSFLKRGTRQN